jgi:hypothetical protein
LDAVADRVFEAPGFPRPSSLDAGAHAWAHAVHLPFTVRTQLRGLLRALQFGAVLTHGSRFTHLDPDQQTAVLQRLGDAEHWLPREALMGLKQLCAVGTFRHPRTWAAIGYDGPTIHRTDAP